MPTPVPANLLPSNLRAAPAAPKAVPINLLPEGLRPKKEAAGLVGSFLENAQTLGLGDEAAAYAANPNEKTRRAFLKAGESKFRQVGFGEGDNWEALKQLVGGSAGQLVAPIAAGLAATPLTTPLGGLAAASATSGTQYTIQNLLRQAQEQEAAAGRGDKLQAVSVGKALTAATGQTALDLVGGKVFAPIAKAFPFMKPLLGKAGGKAAEKAGEVMADAAEKGTIKFAKGVATGIGKGVAFEMPQEVAQQWLERWQAGLSLTDEEAQSEYGQAAIGALVLGGGLGGISGGISARREAAQAAEEAEPVVPPPEVQEPVSPVVKPEDIRSAFEEAAGPERSPSAENVVDALSRTVSQAMSSRSPEDIEAARQYILDREDKIAAGEYTDVSLVDALQRPVMDESGAQVFDAEEKPVYEGALTQAKQMLDAIEPVKPAPPVEITPQSYVDRYLAGEGRGDTPADLEMQQYAANNAADIEAEFARRTQAQEATSEPIGEPRASVDEGIGTRVPPSGEPAPAGAAAPEVGGVEPRPVGVGEPAAPDVAVSADAERGALGPEPLPEPTLEPKKTELNVIPDWAADMRRKLSDSFEGSKALDTWLQGTFGYETLPEQLQTAPKLEMLQTQQAGKSRNLKRDYFDHIIDMTNKLGVDLGDLGMYLWARAAPERNAAVAKSNPEAFPEGGSGLTTAQANEIMAQFKAEGKLAKLNQVARKADSLVDFVLAERVKSGAMSAKQAKTLRAQQQFYMPLKGFAKDGDMLTSGMESPTELTDRQSEAMRALRAASPGGSVREIRQAFGRGTMPFHPLFNLFQDAETAVRTNVENAAMRPLIKSWRKDPSAFEGIFNVYTEKRPKQVMVGKTGVEERWAPVDMQKEYYANRDKYMLVKDNGVNYYIEFASQGAGADLKRMFDNMRPQQMEGALKTIATVNNFLKGMLTYKNPLYLTFVAPFRDTSAAIATAMHHQNLKGSPVYKKNLAARVLYYSLPFTGTWSTLSRYVFGKGTLDDANGKLLKEMLDAGGAPLQTRFLNVEEQASVARQAIQAMKGIENVPLKERPALLLEGLNRWIDGLADIMDMNARFATYRAATDLGVSPQEAARLALDSSLNLTRRGEMARSLDLVFPFFGAGAEASRKTMRIMRNPKSLIKVLGGMVVLGVMESMWNSGQSGDDDNDGQENYLDQDLGAGLRASRFIIYYGSGADEYVKVPVDPMLGYFKFVGNKIGDVMAGAIAPSEATTGLIPGFASLMLPTRIPGTDVQSVGTALTPLVGKPIMENLINRNFFGSPVYKERSFDSAPRSELGYEGTGEGWKALAKAINDITGGSAAVSGKVDFQPEVYRHIIEGYFGGPYQIAKQIAGAKEAEGVADVPGLKSFVGTGAEYAPQTKYFENSSVVRQITNRLKKLSPEELAAQGADFYMDTDPRIMDAYKAVDSALDQLNKDQKATLATAENDEERKAVLDYYRKEKNAYYSAFNTIYNDVKREQ